MARITQASRSPEVAEGRWTDADPLARLAGPTAVAAGTLLVVTQVVQLLTLDRGNMAATLTNPVYVVNGIAQFAAFALLLVAVTAAHQWHARRAGALGVVGLVAALVGTLNLGGNYWFEAFVTPWLAGNLPNYLHTEPSGVLPVGGLSSYLLFAVGWVLFGVAALRAAVIPRAIAAALIIGGAVGFQMVQPPLGVPLALALSWLGFWMLATQRGSRR